MSVALYRCSSQVSYTDVMSDVTSDVMKDVLSDIMSDVSCHVRCHVTSNVGPGFNFGISLIVVSQAVITVGTMMRPFV